MLNKCLELYLGKWLLHPVFYSWVSIKNNPEEKKNKPPNKKPQTAVTSEISQLEVILTEDDQANYLKLTLAIWKDFLKRYLESLPTFNAILKNQVQDLGKNLVKWIFSL